MGALNYARKIPAANLDGPVSFAANLDGPVSFAANPGSGFFAANLDVPVSFALHPDVSEPRPVDPESPVLCSEMSYPHLMTSLGPFEIQGLLGHGAMGVVARGTDRRSDTPVAIKMVIASTKMTAELVETLHREARAIATVAHPNIVQIVDYGVVSAAEARTLKRSLKTLIPAGSPYIAMELANRTFDADLDTPDWRSLRNLLHQILDGLAHAHARGLIHRDLKPDNLLMAATPAGLTPRLTDFGIAMLSEEFETGLRASIAFAGTMAYMAPEQVSNWRHLGPWTDLYALGSMTYKILAGRPPFLGATMQVLMAKMRENPDPITAFRFPVPDGIRGWLDRLLDRNPEARFASAVAARTALDGLGPPAPDTPLLEAIPPKATAGDTTISLPELRETLILARQEAPPHTTAAVRDDVTMPATWRRPAGVPRATSPALFDLRPPPFVGRVDERNHLWTSLQDVVTSSSPRAIVITGASGHGKTRLCDWLATSAHELAGLPTFRAAWSTLPSRSTGLTGLGRSLIGARGLTFDELTAELEAAAEPLTIDAPALAVDLADPDQPTDDSLGFADPNQRLRSYLALLQAVSRGLPFILHCDDVHRNFEARALIDALLSAELPALILATVRDDEADPDELRSWIDAHRDRLEGLPLPILDPPSHRELVASLLPMTEPTRDRLWEATRGNPFFAVNVVGDWLHRGLLYYEGDRWGMTSAAEASLHRSVSDLVLSRIDGLLQRHEGASEAHVELLATLGDTADLDEWSQTCEAFGLPPRPDLIDGLVRCGTGRAEPGLFAFSHAMARDAILRRADNAGRLPALHRACADVLRDAYQTQPRGIARRFAAHLEGAGEPDEAAQVCLEAMAASSHHCDTHATIAFADLRRPLRQDSPFDPSDVQAALSEAGALGALGRADEAQALLEATETLIRREDLDSFLPEVLRYRAMFARNAGKHALACSLFDAVADEFVRRGDLHGAGVASLGTVTSYRFLGRNDLAQARCEAAIDHFEAIHDPFWIVTARRERARLFLAIGHLDDVEDLEALERYADEAGALQVRSLLVNDQARLAWLRGDNERAATLFTQSRDLMREHGDLNAPSTLAHLAAIAIQSGDDSTARHYLDAFDAEAEYSVRSLTPQTCLYRVIVDLRTGAPSKAHLTALIDDFDEQLRRSRISNSIIARAADAAATLLTEDHPELASRCARIFSAHRKHLDDNPHPDRPLLGS